MQTYWKLLLGLVSCSLIASHASPLDERDQVLLYDPVVSQKSWNAPSDPTASLIFNSVNNLLQQWPNTRYRNGHAIVVATLAPGTVVYHGRTDPVVPTTPEWLAMDPEHSYIFCNGVCHLLTFVATREIRLAYFDGSSAIKMNTGVMDTQEILTGGKIKADQDPWNEIDRAADLCAWGKQYQIDGFARMEHDFEIVACDFSNGFQLISSSKIVPHASPHMVHPNYPRREPEIPDGWKGAIPTFPSISFEAIFSGAMHNRAPGETRIQLDYSRIFTFYDSSYTSLVAARNHQSRDEYRAGNISTADGLHAQQRLTDMFSRHGQGSGIDWRSLVHVVADRYGSRLQLVKHLLGSPGPRNITEQAAEVRSQILIMLTPYMLADVISASTSGSRSWVAPIAKHCASTLTSWAPKPLLTREESVIRESIQGVLHEICRVLSDIWVDAFDVEEANIHTTVSFLEKWRNDIDALMTWLDWSMWDVCNPTCGPEELCYIPMWPWIHGGLIDVPADDDGHPRCISRVSPYSTWLDM